MKSFFLALILSLSLSPFLFADAGETLEDSTPSNEFWDKDFVKRFSELPMQEGGRIKPVSTVARFKLLRMYNGRRVKLPKPESGGRSAKLSPTVWFLDCLFRPEVAKTHPTFRISNPDVAIAIGLEPHRSVRERYTYEEILEVRKSLAEKSGAIRARLNDGGKQVKMSSLPLVDQQLLALATNVSEFEYLNNALAFAHNGLALDLDDPLAETAPSVPSKVSAYARKASTVRDALNERYPELKETPPGPRWNQMLQEIMAKHPPLSEALNQIQFLAGSGGDPNIAGLTTGLRFFPPDLTKEESEEWLR